MCREVWSARGGTAMSALADFYTGTLVATALLLLALALGAAGPPRLAARAGGVPRRRRRRGRAGVQPVGDLSPLDAAADRHARALRGAVPGRALDGLGGMAAAGAADRRARPAGHGRDGRRASRSRAPGSGCRGRRRSWSASRSRRPTRPRSTPRCATAARRRRGRSWRASPGFNDPVGIAMMAAAVAADRRGGGRRRGGGGAARAGARDRPGRRARRRRARDLRCCA